MKSRNPLEKVNLRDTTNDGHDVHHCTVKKVLCLLVLVGGPYLLICSYFYFLADEDLDVLMKPGVKFVVVFIFTIQIIKSHQRDTSNRSTLST